MKETRPHLKTFSPYRLWPIGLMVWMILLLSACKPTEIAQQTTISFSTWGSAEEMAITKQLITQFHAEHPHIRVKLLHIPEQYYQKLHLLIAGGIAPDVVLINSLEFPVYASHHVFADLSEQLQKSKAIAPKDFLPAALTAFHSPTLTLGAIPRDLSNLVVFYNKTAFQQAKVSIPQPEHNPKSWDTAAFLKTAQALMQDTDQNGHPERFGISFYKAPPLFWLPFIWSAGGTLWNPETRQFTLTTPQAESGLQFYCDLRQRFHVAPRTEESGGNTMTQLFLQEKLAMMINGRWVVPVLRKQARFAWDILPLPSGPAGSRSGIDASGYALSAHSQNPEAAWQLIEFLSQPQQQATLARSGLLIPARKDIAYSEAFLSPQQVPTHASYFLSSLKTGIPSQVPTRWHEVSEALTLALEPAFEGRMSVHQALSPLVKTLPPLLQEAKQ